MAGLHRERSLDSSVSAAAFVIVAFCLTGLVAFAQDRNPSEKIAGDITNWHELAPGGPAPRAADGHPDLSGLYFPNSAGRQIQRAYPVDPAARRQFDPKATPEEKPSFKPGAEKYQRPAEDYGGCVQPGTPKTLLQENTTTWPMQLIQTPGRLVILIEYPMDFRVIHTDGRPHAADPDPTFNGNSVAHWEGDTLVIDTVAIDERMPNFGGWFHSDQEHVIERISRPSMNYVVYQVTVEDPLVLAKPWSSAPRRWSLSVVPDDDVEEFFCTTNEEPQEWQKEGRPSNSF